MSDEPKIKPSVPGPCWFCRKNSPTDDMVMDREFDTDVHLSCILEALGRDPCDAEARIMAYLLETKTETPPEELG